jgi:hypothetical protein
VTTATRKKPAGRKRPAAKRAPKAPKRTAGLQPVFRINKVGDASNPKGVLFSIEDRRTGKRVSTHKTFPAAWARRLKLFQAVYTSEDHD